MVFEEDLPLKNDHASTLRNSGGWERDYSLIAQLYQQLKKNYDDQLDYWTADHFHFGEMEMQRLAVPRTGPLLKLRQFYHRNLSLVAWYRRGSSYGNGYVRPAIWLLCILALFALLFPLPGLQKGTANPALPHPRPSPTDPHGPLKALLTTSCGPRSNYLERALSPPLTPLPSKSPLSTSPPILMAAHSQSSRPCSPRPSSPCSCSPSAASSAAEDKSSPKGLHEDGQRPNPDEPVLSHSGISPSSTPHCSCVGSTHVTGIHADICV